MREQIKEAVYKDFSNILGIVAYKNNKKIYEEYFNNADENESVHAFSVAKSVMAIIIGIAIDKGFIESVHKKLLDYFPDYQLKKNQEQLKEVTIEDFLTMRVPYKFKSDPFIKVFSSSNIEETILKLIGGTKQTDNKFHYSTVGMQILSEVIYKATNMRLKDFAQKYLFDLLDIPSLPDVAIYDQESHMRFYQTRNNRGWARLSKNNYSTGWGLSLTTNEYARIGLLVLNKGMYNNKRIVSESWINEMLTERESKYGYLWWLYPKQQKIKLFRRVYNTGPYDSYCATGIGGSVISIIPEKNIVICCASAYIPNPKVRTELINNYLLPYIESLSE